MRIASVLLLLAGLFGLTACGSSDPEQLGPEIVARAYIEVWCRDDASHTAIEFTRDRLPPVHFEQTVCKLRLQLQVMFLNGSIFHAILTVRARSSVDGGPTALQEAAALGRADSVEVLLRAGANPRAKDDFGTTPRKAAEAASKTTDIAPRIGPLLAGGLRATTGRWLHEELGLTGVADAHREVIALLRAVE